MYSKIRPAICVCALLTVLGAVFVTTTVPAAQQPASQGPADAVVKMTAEHKFLPDKVTIKVGQTVEWANEEPNGLHEITTDPDIAVDPSDVAIPDGAKPFDSKMLKEGKTFRHQFTVPGVYKYACPPHEESGMVGQVIVAK